MTHSIELPFNTWPNVAYYSIRKDLAVAHLMMMIAGLMREAALEMQQMIQMKPVKLLLQVEWCVHIRNPLRNCGNINKLFPWGLSQLVILC